MILDEVAAVFEQEGDDAAEESERLPSLRMVRGSGSRQSHASAALSAKHRVAVTSW